ncbi:hypothetical protein [Mycolicibacterium fluoranthenivorans]|uniref:Uncharacterized protein n=1 Tax=Mycolicibacterium fluoranthenivorans TaxID=258505 RepID=A0A1G4VH06_9MYCO|nr:hypothetical protein [Mycolicibacterium fluoranthenivorans]SCX06084.1 hypothetical protein SAMN02799620_00809 [Mycolicibacterium fluoranthenivorans]
MAVPKFWVPYLKWDAFVADAPAELGGDADTDPQQNGIHAGVEITAKLSKGDYRAIRALTAPMRQLFALGSQDCRLDNGYLKLTAAQQEFGLLAKCSVLDLPDDVDIIYTFRPHHVTYNGTTQDLPTITVKAPVIPDSYDPEVSGPFVQNLAEMEWLNEATAAKGGFVIRQVPDDVQREDLAIQFYSSGSPIGDPLSIADLLFQGSIDDVHDLGAAGMAVAKSETVDAIRQLIKVANWLNATAALTTAVAPAAGTMYRYNAAGGALSVPLPLVMFSREGDRLSVEKTDTSANTVTVTSGQLVDGASVVCRKQGHRYDFQAVDVDGALRWKVVGERRPLALVVAEGADAAAARAAIGAASLLSAAGSYVYDTNGYMISTPDGATYTWESDGFGSYRLHTETVAGVTRTFTYNLDGSLDEVF